MEPFQNFHKALNVCVPIVLTLKISARKEDIDNFQAYIFILSGFTLPYWWNFQEYTRKRISVHVLILGYIYSIRAVCDVLCNPWSKSSGDTIFHKRHDGPKVYYLYKNDFGHLKYQGLEMSATFRTKTLRSSGNEIFQVEVIWWNFYLVKHEGWSKFIMSICQGILESDRWSSESMPRN